ncbi:MAG: hypothetical protein LQ338_004584 [Usnochroma carphineum]|nr:MAG: hypothetical protein LQ338_004584 [Usnochroma carphineum]
MTKRVRDPNLLMFSRSKLVSEIEVFYRSSTPCTERSKASIFGTERTFPFSEAKPLTKSSSFTQSKASSYGLTGFVRNASGGQVEGEAQGDDEAIQKLLKVLESGPPAATVTKVEKSEIDVKEGESSYTTK